MLVAAEIVSMLFNFALFYNLYPNNVLKYFF